LENGWAELLYREVNFAKGYLPIFYYIFRCFTSQNFENILENFKITSFHALSYAIKKVPFHTFK